MDIVTVRTYFDPILAELARMRLEEEGIRCFLADQMAASMPMVFGSSIGIRLQVMEKDIETALTILNTHEDELSLSIEDSSHPADFNELKKQQPFTEANTESRGDSCCPKCQSDRVTREYFTTLGKWLLTILLLGLPLLFIVPSHKCRRCGHTW